MAKYFYQHFQFFSVFIYNEILPTKSYQFFKICKRFDKEREKTLMHQSMRKEKLGKVGLCFITGCFIKSFFSTRVFFRKHWRFTGQQEKGGDHLLFHSTTSTRSRTFRHLFATLHVRWLSRIFNRNACVYQTATRWDLRLYRITIFIDWLMMQYLLVYLMNWF